MSLRNDPFSAPEVGFEPWAEPTNSDKEFSQADLTPTTLKAWLRSPECAAELGQQLQNPIRAVIRFVNTAHGMELHIERGDVVRVYIGPLDELKKIARAAS